MIELAEHNKISEATIGHGLGDTIWNGWQVFVILDYFSEFHLNI